MWMWLLYNSILYNILYRSPLRMGIGELQKNPQQNSFLHIEIADFPVQILIYSLLTGLIFSGCQEPGLGVVHTNLF